MSASGRDVSLGINGSLAFVESLFSRSQMLANVYQHAVRALSHLAKILCMLSQYPHASNIMIGGIRVRCSHMAVDLASLAECVDRASEYVHTHIRIGSTIAQALELTCQLLSADPSPCAELVKWSRLWNPPPRNGHSAAIATMIQIGHRVLVTVETYVDSSSQEATRHVVDIRAFGGAGRDTTERHNVNIEGVEDLSHAIFLILKTAVERGVVKPGWFVSPLSC